jgi:putative lipoprotein
VKVAPLGILLATALVAPVARADDDPWTSQDKLLHYGVSAGIASGGYVAGAIVFDERAYALATGATLAVIAGVGKELADLAGFGDPSWKDLAWDGLGMLTGLALTWGIDLAIRGVSARQPALAKLEEVRGRIAF